MGISRAHNSKAFARLWALYDVTWHGLMMVDAKYSGALQLLRKKRPSRCEYLHFPNPSTSRSRALAGFFRFYNFKTRPLSLLSLLLPSFRFDL